MAKYETVFIINPNATEEEAAAVTEKIKGVIETGGTVMEVSEWGKKRLAYEIQKLREGYYVLIKFEAVPQTLEELNHIFRITENVLRGIVVKLEK